MREDELAESPLTTDPPSSSDSGDRVVFRHRLSTRIWHWINALTLLVMLMSGLMIFNAHPHLYWGQYGANPDPAWLAIGSDGDEGFLRIGSLKIETTGVLGLWRGNGGRMQDRAFPSWITIPSYYDLATSRRWHLTFAWLLSFSLILYGLWSILNGHVRRDLAPSGRELRPGHIFNDIKKHAMLKFPRGDAARHYNILQKLSYIIVIFIFIPLMVLTGLTMSPAMDAAWPWLLDIFGGRQTARSIHFLTAFALVLFVCIHLAMVILAGPVNELRSMITGRYRLPKEKP